MPVARGPLPVEVVTKIPVQTGLDIVNPTTTGAITRTTAQAVNPTVQVVQNVPSTLKNITPVSVGQKLVSFGKGAATAVGTAFSGVSGLLVGAATAAILTADAALFAKPAGRGSDMVGGIKLGQKPQVQPQVQPQVRPQVQQQIQPQVRPQVQPQVQPQVRPQVQPQIQQQVRPQVQPQVRPQIQPQIQRQIQPRNPLTVVSPQPRAPLQTPSPESKTPISPDSPYPLNLVELNSYGGVNLNYPIAQKLIDFDNRFDEIERQLQQIPPSVFEDFKKAKIETIITIPTKNEITAQIPVTTHLNSILPVNLGLDSQLPMSLNLNKEVPINMGLNSVLPVNLGIDSQLPMNFNLNKEVPLNMGLSSILPVNLGIDSQLPMNLNLNKEVPVNMGLNSVLPVNLGIDSQLPMNLNLNKEVPVNMGLNSILPINMGIDSQFPMKVDLSTVLRPDNEASGLKSLKECCEAIQNILTQKEKIFEGNGYLVCDNATIPYSYRGPGLTGIHQLIKIILGANTQILEKICTLDSNQQNPQPIIQGSGVYACGTLPVIYNYSGVGLLGIQNQIDNLFQLDKKILTEVCEIGSLPLLNSLPFPEISGKLEYFDCDYNTQAILYSGNGIQGLSKQLDAVTEIVKIGAKAACDRSSIAIMPDARFEQFKAKRQMQITWGTKYPTQQGSLWHSYLPNPRNDLNWCKDFENLQHQKGNVYGQVEWENSKIPTGLYCSSEEEVTRILLELIKLSAAVPTTNELGQPKVVILKGNSSKRIIQERRLRAVRVAISEIGDDGNVASVKCFTPPPEGCSPTII